MPTQQSGEAEVNLLQMADLLEKSGNHHHAEILRLYEQKLRLTIFPMFRTKTMNELRDSEESFRLGRLAGIKEAMEALDQLPAWPDPATDLDNGISAMFDSGLIRQYKYDKEKHEQDLQNLKSRLKYLTIKEV